jgi:hypothetical protein
MYKTLLWERGRFLSMSNLSHISAFLMKALTDTKEEEAA